MKIKIHNTMKPQPIIPFLTALLFAITGCAQPGSQPGNEIVDKYKVIEFEMPRVQEPVICQCH